MLDIEFLRGLGVKEEVLPAPEANGNTIAEKENIADLPIAGEFMVPPEILDLSEEELKRLIINKYSQDNPYKCITPQGHVVAIYPHSGEGRYDLEFTVDELVVMMRLMRDLDAKVTAYQPHDGSWLTW